MGLELSAHPGFKVRVRYDDGFEGEVDLSDLAGRGVFATWNKPEVFGSAFIGPQGQLSWGNDIELCPDAVSMRLTGKAPDEVFPALRKAQTRA